MKITKYSCYNTYDLKARGDNYCNIVDKLIRLTAKITECFASDIIYDIAAYQECVRTKQPYDFILCFREMGVNSYRSKTVMEPDFECFYMSEIIQLWRLCYNPEEDITMLSRVDLTKEG